MDNGEIELPEQFVSQDYFDADVESAIEAEGVDEDEITSDEDIVFDC